MRKLRLFAAVLALGLLAAACGDSANSASTDNDTTDDEQEDGAPALTGEPIVIGSVADSSGPAAFAEIHAAFEAYVDEWNREGGVDGRPIRLIEADAGGNATQAANAAQQVVSSDDAVALVNGSTFDCAVNRELYETAQVPVIPFVFGGDCYISPVMFPAAGETIVVSPPMAKFMVEELGRERIAYVVFDHPGAAVLVPAFEDYIAGTDAELVYTKVLPATATAADHDGVLAEINASGADAIVAQIPPPMLALMLQQAAVADMSPSEDLPWVANVSAYNPEFLAGLGDAATGLSVQCLTYCWEVENDATAEALSVLDEAGAPTHGFAHLAYTGMALMRDVLESVEGDITRESVLETMSSMSDVQPALAPYTIDFTTVPSEGSPRQFEGGNSISTWNGERFELAAEWVPFP